MQSNHFPSKAAIHGAARRGHESVVEKLAHKDVGANLDLQDNNGWAPLHHAADSGHEKAVKVLLEANATVDLRDSTQGATSLHYAAHRGHLGVVRLLLEYNASQMIVSNDGWTPLHVACRLRRSEVVRLLLQPTSSPVSVRGRRNWTPLHVAAWTGDAGIVRSLLERGAELGAELIDSWAPLHLAAMSGRTEALMVLLEHGANSMQRETRIGWTSLDTAILFQHKECAMRLIGHCMTIGDDRYRECFEILSVGHDPSPVVRAAERRIEREMSRNWSSAKTIDGRQLHAAMSGAGFVRPRAILQAAVADHLQDLIGEYSGNEVRICGSFAEGWGCSVSRLSGRVDEDSDIDVSEYFHGRPHHLEGRCRCPGRKIGPGGSQTLSEEVTEGSDDNDKDEDAYDGSVRESAMLKYSRGHVKFSGYAAHPARTQYGCLGRPAMDMAVMYRCCSYPHIHVLDMPGYLPAKLIAKLRNEAERLNSCPLIGAALPGMEGRQMRISTKWFELPIVRSFSDIQGQLYTILKYLVKRVINQRGGRLKSFHAKTLAFHVMRDTPPERWQPERLPELMADALDKLARTLQIGDPEVGMRSFFFSDAPLYLRRSTSESDNATQCNATLDAVLKTRKDLPEVLTAFANKLQPLRPNTGLDYHPFMLLPRSKQTKQFSLERSMQHDLSVTAQLEYHELHEFVRCRLRDLAVGGSGGNGDLSEFLACLDIRMPDCARTARECLAALACLRHDKPNKALSRLNKLLTTGHKPMRGLAPFASDEDDLTEPADGAEFVRRQLLNSDSAWRFCFVQDPLRGPLRFDYLPVGIIRFPRRLLRYDYFYAVNFDALAKSLYLWLRQDQIDKKGVYLCDVDDLSRRWFSEMLDAEMDASEIELLVSRCRHEDLLVRLVREHGDTLAQSRTVHCMLADRIKISKKLQRTLKQTLLNEILGETH